MKSEQSFSSNSTHTSGRRPVSYQSQRVLSLLACGLSSLLAGNHVDAQERPDTLAVAVDSEISLTVDSGVLLTLEKAKLVLIHDVSVASRDGGIVAELFVAEGDTVSADEAVIGLDRQLHEAQLETAVQQRLIAAKESQNDIDIRYARKSAAVNEQVLARSQEAAKDYQKSISKTEIERLKLELERSHLSGEQAEHSNEVAQLTYQLRAAEERMSLLQLSHREIKSPLAGQVVEVFTQAGQYLAAGEPVVRIVNLDRLKVEAYATSELVFELKKGQRADFTVETGGRTLSASGEVVFVSPEIDPLNSDLRLMIEIDNSEQQFRPGMLGRLQIFK